MIGGMLERRMIATGAKVRAALLALDGDPVRVRASAWPGALRGVELPGLYSWWADAAGAADLADGLGVEVSPGRIYAG
jgi:hypothetical protein